MAHRLPVDLPEVEFHDPAAFPTESIFGPHGITAHIPSMARILDWQEQRAIPYQGYYRLIHPPFLKRLRARLQAHYAVDWAVPYCSPEIALKELLEFLRFPHPAQRVFLAPGSERLARAALAAGFPCAPAPDAARAAAGDVLLFGEASSVSARALLDAFRSAGATLVGCSPSLPAARDAVDLSDWWVAALEDETAGLTAAFTLTRRRTQAVDLNERNRRRGGLMPSRAAAWWLGGPDAAPEAKVVDEVASRLAELEGARHAFVYPSGMHGIVEAFETLWTPERPEFVVVGHPYSDSHLILGEMPWAPGRLLTHFLQVSEQDRLPALLAGGQVGAVLLETLTNPLIEIPDLPAIAAACRAAGVPLVVDNTFATPANCRPLQHGATVVLHSTSKFLSGSNEHGGGVVMTSDDAIARRLADRQKRLRNRMSPFEAAALAATLPTFADRMRRFNANGLRVARLLASHPAVERVYFPGMPESPVPSDASTWLSGFGSVVSFTFREPGLDPVRRMYDTPTPSIRKAPTLGSDATLMCPYVMLTYYRRTDEYLRPYRLPRYLVRLAVGSEVDFAGVEADLLRALGRNA
ncbi:MAG: PLP-dependent transferase [Kiritimatiellia bacterium]